MPAVQVDGKYRVLIPKEARKHIQPGDVLFVEETDGILHYAKAENPFDGLARHAVEEYRAGRTVNLREFAGREGIDLSGQGEGEEGPPGAVPGRVDRPGHKGSGGPPRPHGQGLESPSRP